MAYLVLALSAFLALSAATALRPGRRGLFAALAFPVGWAAGELAGQALVVEAVLIALLHWWGWPRTDGLGEVVIALAALVAVENLALLAISFRSRTVVRRALEGAPDRALALPGSAEDRFGTWWRTALQFSPHPRGMEIHRDLAYGKHPRNRLDVWRLPDAGPGAPVVLYLHGGAWTFGDKREQGRPMLHEFVAHGWVAVTPNYRLAPRDPWPAPMQDAVAALAWVKREIESHGGDPDRVVVSGGSAGGHLAALVGLAGADPAWRPEGVGDEVDLSVRAVLSYYGVLEMTGDEDHWNGLGEGLVHLLERRVVQLPYEGHEDLYRSISPMERIGRDAPTFLVVQGTNDTLVDYRVARAFVTRFRASAFAPCYHVELPFTQHAFDVTASPRTSATTRAALAVATAAVATAGPVPPELAASYQAPPTVLEVELDGRRVGALEALTALGPYVVVTPDNPYSVPTPPEANARRRVEMAASLAALGLDARRTRASDPTGDWPSEEGFALAGLSREDAAALSRAWGQYAFYEVTGEGVCVRDAARGARI